MKVIEKKDYHKDPPVPDWKLEYECYMCGSKLELEPRDLIFQYGLFRANCINCKSTFSIDKKNVTEEIFNYILRLERKNEDKINFK